jgi:hypothetical protein
MLSSPKTRPHRLLDQQYGRSFPEGGKRRGCEVDPLHPPSAKVKNEWSYTSVPPTCLNGVGWDFSYDHDNDDNN